MHGEGMFSPVTTSLRRVPPMNQSDDRWDVESHPDWLTPIFSFMKENQDKFRMGVFGTASTVLKMVETEQWVKTPLMCVGRNRNLILRWEFPNGVILILDFFCYAEFRYRYQTYSHDSGTVIVKGNMAQVIRRLFRDTFGANQVTKESMMFNVGRRFA